ncbi:MAG TPA: glycine cleavage system aminomethyltransferase GcvT [Phycisphaerae bacterium]|nr:glycine cleavage system aminomethyltransferase GcvT [Phycisphaerae bacterium]
MPELNRTPFYDFHIKSGARMVAYAGWEMPLLYRGIIDEHLHTRTAASIFDVSHMGRLKFTGKGAEEFLQRVCTRNLAKAAVGQSMYSLVCKEDGGILDDVIVSRFDNGGGHWLLVCNAANREKLLAWFDQNKGQTAFSIEDETLKTAMVAIQGPKAVGLLDEVLPEPVSDLKRYHFQVMRYMLMIQFTVFRSGYTGEDGAEIICGTTAASLAMNYLLKSDGEHALLKPAGLGARDTLRLEAGMPLYGHELTEETDPLSAGLDWAVDLQKDFVGADALRRKHDIIQRRSGPFDKLVGLILDGARSARQGMAVTQPAGGARIGTITSGAYSPTLKNPIAMAYIRSEEAEIGDKVEVQLSSGFAPATITPLPFYKRPKKP